MKINWKKILPIVIVLGLGASLYEKWIPSQFNTIGIVGETILVAWLVYPFLIRGIGQKTMTDEECIKLADQKVKKISTDYPIKSTGQGNYEFEGFDMLDTQANPELQRFRGWAPISGIMWTVRAVFTDKSFFQLFGDAKIKNSTTHIEFGEQGKETPITEQLKSIQVKQVYPKNARFIQPTKYKREEKTNIEVKST